MRSRSSLLAAISSEGSKEHERASTNAYAAAAHASCDDSRSELAGCRLRYVRRKGWPRRFCGADLCQSRPLTTRGPRLAFECMVPLPGFFGRSVSSFARGDL